MCIPSGKVHSGYEHTPTIHVSKTCCLRLGTVKFDDSCEALSLKDLLHALRVGAVTFDDSQALSFKDLLLAFRDRKV